MGPSSKNGGKENNQIELEIMSDDTETRSLGNIVNSELFCTISSGFKREFDSDINHFYSSQLRDETGSEIGNETTIEMHQTIARNVILKNEAEIENIELGQEFELQYVITDSTGKPVNSDQSLIRYMLEVRVAKNGIFPTGQKYSKF